MDRSEPTTEEIMSGLRNCANDDTPCTPKCINFNAAGGCRTKLMNDAADRLESQAKQIAELTAAIKTQSDLCRECAALTVIEQKAEIDALTARAESAERERDAAIEEIQHSCHICKSMNNETGYCSRIKGNPYRGRKLMWTNCTWEWRGLQPQDGWVK